MKMGLAISLFLFTSFLNLAIAGQTSAAAVTMLMQQNLTPLDNQEALVLTVRYEAGGSSKPHRHNADVFVYMLEGSVVMQIEGGKEVILKPGETFHESRDDVHTVSKNASAIEPATFLVFIIKDKNVSATLPIQAGH